MYRDMKNMITIYLCLPDHSIKILKTKPSLKIITLQKMYQSSMTFIFNGQILCENQTFEFYAIKNEDYIIALHKKSKKKISFNLFHWLNESRNDTFRENVQMIMRKESKAEAARLFDLSLYKIEGNRKIYMKHIKRNMNDILGDNSKSSENIDLIVDYPNSEVPSCSSLPTLW